MSVSAQQTTPTPAEVWSSGDYADVCERMIPDLGARLVELADVQAGDEVLDVAAGSGNAALPAARAGAIVTALDVTAPLLEIGSWRASAAGLDVDWVLGDAQALPFVQASFDRVLSCVGVQFCADHDAAASELVRVCRPGGRIALIAWTREGFIGQVLAAVATATGGAGSGRSPLDWGAEAWVTEVFGAGVTAGTWICRPNRPSAGSTTWPRRMGLWCGHAPRSRREGNGSPCVHDSA
jgi:SAM-dependent methyltransferase